MKINVLESRAAGYSFLLKTLKIHTASNWHSSIVANTSAHQTQKSGNLVEDIYPISYWPGDTIGDHLEFALKYDGVNLKYLFLIFNAIKETDIIHYIQSKPTGKYARRIWFFYEFLTGNQLPIKALNTGNYIEALESENYYTLNPGQKVQKQRIINNLLGDNTFCPIVRKTDKLKIINYESMQKKCEQVIKSYPHALLKRALNYLYTKETKSSFEIEQVKLSPSRVEKFVAMLQLAEQQDFCNKSLLIELQNKIVDPRMQDFDYRTNQNYIGETVSYQREIIHYISPKPKDLPALMQGLLTSHQLMKEGNVSPIIHAAITAYGFVFLHPFEDGNGRIHRFLIHNIFSIRNMTPKGLMFPVSAIMQKKMVEYDSSLEAFSRLLMPFVEYDLDEEGRMNVLNDTAYWYRYMDMSAQAEALYDFVNYTIETEFTEELDFLVHYDNTKKAIQNIIDLPDRRIDLFIRFCLQNKGVLSTKKRAAYFDFLTNEELLEMENVVKMEFNLGIIK